MRKNGVKSKNVEARLWIVKRWGTTLSKHSYCPSAEINAKPSQHSLALQAWGKNTRCLHVVIWTLINITLFSEILPLYRSMSFGSGMWLYQLLQFLIWLSSVTTQYLKTRTFSTFKRIKLFWRGSIKKLRN